MALVQRSLIWKKCSSQNTNLVKRDPLFETVLHEEQNWVMTIVKRSIICRYSSAPSHNLLSTTAIRSQINDFCLSVRSAFSTIMSLTWVRVQEKRERKILVIRVSISYVYFFFSTWNEFQCNGKQFQQFQF